ncbi:MAG: hypothetical protein QXK64_02600 [Candidatus Woesearchaeota archaeon]
MEIKEAYERLRKRYPELPPFQQLDFEFELSTIEKERFEEPFILRLICSRISEKVSPLKDFFDQLLQPEATSFSSIYESRCFTEAEKHEILDVYKKYMLFVRALDEALLMLDDKKYVEVVKLSLSEWPDVRKAVLPFLKKLRECWKTPFEKKRILEYLG